MLSGERLVEELRKLDVTHVVWLPDSAIGPWEDALEADPDITLVRVCREGEAWSVAAGLHLGGKRPIVAIQCTGLFESGDALRNALYDLGLPLFAVIGYRSYLVAGSKDTAKQYTEPVLKAWDVDYRLIDTEAKITYMAEHYQACQTANKPGAVLVAEGRM